MSLKMKRLYLVLYAFGLLGVPLFAQQELQYTQFMFNKMAYNPGYAGSFESPTLVAVYRQQWMGIEGAPNVQAISYNQPLLNNRVGVGANLVRASFGITRTMTFDVAYCYRVPMRRGYLGIGLQASLRHLYQDWTDDRLITSRPDDPAVPLEPKTKLVPNFGFGLFYNGPHWFAGIAAPRLVSNNIDFAENGGVLSREAQHINGMVGVTFNLADDIEFTPQVLIKYVSNAPVDADVNMSIMVKRKFYGGLTYRTGGESNGAGESIDALAGMQVTENLFFCLSYDIGLTQLRKFNNGSIEATARWWFNPPEGEEIINPRDGW